MMMMMTMIYSTLACVLVMLLYRGGIVKAMCDWEGDDYYDYM